MERVKTLLASLLLAGFTGAAYALPVNDGLVMNLNADSISVSSLGGNGEISSWPDSSGLGNNAIQSTEANRPILNANNADFKGHATVVFDGSNDWMDLNSSMINVGEFTMFTVGRYFVTNKEHYLVAGQSTGNDDRCRICMDNSQRFLLRAGTSGLLDITSSANTNIHVFALSSATTNAVEGFLDGASMGTSTNTSTANPASFNIGSYNRGQKNFLDGELAAVIVYDRALTATEIEEMNSYLINKYTVSVTNPVPADGTAGVGVAGNDVVSVTLGWDAAPDPVNTDMVDPDVAKHYVYMSNGSETDPNLYLVGEVSVTDYSTKSYTYGPISLPYDKSYTWMIEEGLADGVGGAQAAGDPNNFSGDVWSFSTLLSVPDITAQPKSSTFELGGEITLDIAFDSISAAAAVWYKDGVEVVADSRITITSDSSTSILNIKDMVIGDEGSYYCELTSEGGVTPSDSATLVTRKLLARYEFEQNLNDFNGVNNGALVNTLNYVEGIEGDFAVESLNAGGYVELSTSAYPKAGFGNGMEQFTYSYWAKPSSALSGEGRVFGCFNDGGSTGMQVGIAGDGALRFYMRQEGGTWGGIDTAANSVPDEQWSHITLTYSGTQIAYYVNGSMIQQQNMVTLNNFADWQYSMTIMAKNSRSDIQEYYSGQIDDLRIYNYAMSETEVADVYLETAGGTVCIESLRPSSVYDFNNDCAVDIKDFADFAENWLDSGLYSGEVE